MNRLGCGKTALGIAEVIICTLHVLIELTQLMKTVNI